MTNVDSVARGLVDQFFAQCHPEAASALAHWHDTGELDRVTVSQLRLWAANRTLDVLARPSSSTPQRAAIINERHVLIDWLETQGHPALG
ncbi:hypothetical protein [Streptomyces sediminimaris]|uniref:hypothetical protein n=1 Tax=Streptomyces sediminimaris TaxID=3383721 RepID=UPI00399A27E5